jgi:hypothetical protein
MYILLVHAACPCRNAYVPSAIIIQYFEANYRCGVRIFIGLSLKQKDS